MACLVAILLLGAYFRFVGLDWDASHHLHPDERFLTIVSNKISPVENPLDYLRTSRSTLNPYNFDESFYVYGNFPMTVTRYVAEWTAALCDTLSAGRETPLAFCTRAYVAYDGVYLVGRLLSGLIDLVSILFTFFIARRLYNQWAGLLAALLLALAVMPIQQSHFYTMDNWAAAFTTAAIYAAVRAAAIGDNEPRWRLRWYALFGLCLGLAAASRVNIAPLASVIGVGAVIWLARRGYTWGTLFNPEGTTDLQRVVVAVALAGFVSLLTFRLAQPYAFTDSEMVRQQALNETGQEPGFLRLAVGSVIGPNPQWLSNMAEIQRLQQPEASFPPALQWTDRAPLLFPFTNMVLYGMGVTAGLFAWIALFWALWRMLHRENRWGDYPEWMVHAIPVFWTLLYFLFMGTRWVKSVRYFLPIYPTLFILAGWGLVFLWQKASRASTERGFSRRLRQVAVAGLIGVVVLPSLAWASMFTQIYREPVTRVAASDWIFENVPSGATLIYDAADGRTHELPIGLKAFFFEPSGVPLLLSFTLPEDGTARAIRFNYLSDADEEESRADGETLRVQLNNAEPVELALNLDQIRRAVTLDLPATPLFGNVPQQLIVDAGPGGNFRAGTSILVNEHWDDLLPISTNGRNAYGAFYTEVAGGQRPVTHPDSPEKLEEVIAWLNEADFIMISSQRAMWHLPRLPLTYPLMMRYYEALFSGELGFDLAAQFHGNLRLGPLYVSDTAGRIGWGKPPEVGWPPPGDLAAEEAFSVYDHPPVWIFAKSDRYDPEKTRALLGGVDLSRVTIMNPLQATQAPNGLMLSEPALQTQQANGTFSEVFNVDGLLARQPALAAVVWYLALFLLGWVAFPLAYVAFRGLPDRGYPLARGLSLLALSYIPWLLASLNVLPHTRSAILLALGLIAALSAFVFLRRRAELVAFARNNLAYIGLVELVSLGLFLLLLFVRLGNPDVWDVIWGGEKPMDLSYFTAVMKSTTFPPYDPWLAGGYINYYYYGFVYVGALVKLLGIMPTIAYNLILPTLFSLTGLGVFSLAYSLVAALNKSRQVDATVSGADAAPGRFLDSLSRPAATAGLVAVLLALLVGNLAQVGVIGNAWYKAGNPSLDGIPLVGGIARVLDGGVRVLTGEPAPMYPGDWFWNASRAINANEGEVAPITEFPYFTFLYGDLHAHMISLPLTLLALAWAVALALQSERDAGMNERSYAWWETAWQWAAGAVAIGALRATNTWDWPTFLLFGALAVAYYVYRRAGRLDLRVAGRALLLIIALFGFSTLAFWPYADNYGVGYSSLSLWPGSYTYLSNYLVIFGLFLFFIVPHLLREARAWAAAWTDDGLRRLAPLNSVLILLPVLYVALLLLLVLRGYWIAPVALTLALGAGLLAVRPNLETARRIVLLLIAAALALTLMVEIVVLDGDIGRMNTVFKFYMQVWILLSVASGPAAVWLWPAIRSRRDLRRTWGTVLALLLFAALLYPLVATPARWSIRMNRDAPNSLDGMAFMPYVEYGDTDFTGSGRTIRLADDYEAIRWLQRHVEGSPVILEAHSSNPYRSIANRVAMYTGLPAVVGWDWHQRQQRAVVPGDIVAGRINDVNTIYNTADVEQAMALLNKYGVKYIYVGSLENAYYLPDGLAKFERMAADGLLMEVYRDDAARIYEVVRSASG